MNLSVITKNGNFNFDTANKEYLVLDVETTSFSKNEFRIIEIAFIVITADGFRKKSWHTLVDPECKVTFTKVHGLTDEDVKEAPKFSQIADYLAKEMANRIMVGHNISYDYGVLKQEFARIGVKMPSLPRICTLQMCYDLELALENVTLTTVRKELQIPEGLAHSALHDTAATTAVFSSLLKLYQLRFVSTMRAYSGSALDDLANQNWMPPQLFESEFFTKQRIGISLDSVADFPTIAQENILIKLSRSEESAQLSAQLVSTCPQCGIGLVVIKNRYAGGQFKGCSKFPECRYSENLEALPN
jgi:DNA polymerase III epsilon subunit family exonuclease